MSQNGQTAAALQPPTISLSGARASYVGPGLVLDPHANAAATVLIAFDAPFRLRLADGECCTASTAVIPPGTRHHLQTDGRMAFVYLDAMSDDYAALAELDLTSAFDAVLGQACQGVDAICTALGVPSRAAPDPRIAGVVAELCACPDAFEGVEDAARRAGLSPSRFQRLFSRSVGVPFRRFRVWRRMSVVARCVAAGWSLTASAHEAGFSSSSHLSVSFRQMFGLRPRDLVDLVDLGARFDLAS